MMNIRTVRIKAMTNPRYAQNANILDALMRQGMENLNNPEYWKDRDKDEFEKLIRSFHTIISGQSGNKY
jgi:hypothetical protein